MEVFLRPKKKSCYRKLSYRNSLYYRGTIVAANTDAVVPSIYPEKCCLLLCRYTENLNKVEQILGF